MRARTSARIYGPKLHIALYGPFLNQPPFLSQDLQNWAHGVYAPDLVGANDTGLCVAQPGEPPSSMEMVAIMDMGFGRLVALYGPPSSVIWLPQGRELPHATGEREELTVILGLTKKVGSQ